MLHHEEKKIVAYLIFMVLMCFYSIATFQLKFMQEALLK